MRGCAKSWIVEHAPWVVMLLLALRLPPLIEALALNLSRLAETGWHPLADAADLIAAAQLGLMTAALPGLFQRTRCGWGLLVAALAIAAGLAMWCIITAVWQGPVAPGPFIGGRILPAVLLVVATYVFVQVRPEYGDSPSASAP